MEITAFPPEFGEIYGWVRFSPMSAQKAIELNPGLGQNADLGGNLISQFHCRYHIRIFNALISFILQCKCVLNYSRQRFVCRSQLRPFVFKNPAF